MKQKNKYRNVMLFFGVVWLVFDLFLMRGYLNLYLNFPSLDFVSHLLFGVFIGTIFLYNKFNLKKAFVWTLIISLAWEIIEKIGDTLFSQPYYLLDFFIYDGVMDILAHFIGVYLIYKYYKKN